MKKLARQLWMLANRPLTSRRVDAALRRLGEAFILVTGTSTLFAVLTVFLGLLTGILIIVGLFTVQMIAAIYKYQKQLKASGAQPHRQQH